MTLKELQIQLIETKTMAESEVPFSAKSRSGWEARKGEAREQLIVIRKEFAKAFKEVAVPYVVSGTDVDFYIKSIPGKKKTIIMDDPLAEIKSAVNLSIGPSSEFGVSAYMVLLRELRQIGVKLGLTSIDIPSFQCPEYVAGEAAVGVIVERYVEKALGSDLSVLVELKAYEVAEKISFEDGDSVFVFVEADVLKDKEKLYVKIFNKVPNFVDTDVKSVESEVEVKPKKAGKRQ